MRLDPPQFGARENTASPRQHASRLAGSSSSREYIAELQDQNEATARGPRDVEVVDLPLTDPTNEATGGKAEETAVLVKRDPLQVWMAERARERVQRASFP
jgi:hypothetical protein